MSGSGAEHRRLHAAYRSRGRTVQRASWSELHLAGSAVIAETDSSAYVFIPVYLGKEHLTVPGGGFRMACFNLESTDEAPEVLIIRPFDVSVGETLWLAIAEDHRTVTSTGLTIGALTLDLTKQIPTSTVNAIYVVLADPGAPEF